MRFKGSPEFEEFWSYLEDESPRGLTVVIAAFFDEKLGSMLSQSQHHRLSARINAGLANGLLTRNEHEDLHVIRDLRNSFAHDLRAKSFDTAKTQQVEALKTWQFAVVELPQYAEMMPTTRERLLYVAGVIAVRLNHRTAGGSGPLPEPPFLDVSAWPPLTSR